MPRIDKREEPSTLSEKGNGETDKQRLHHRGHIPKMDLQSNLGKEA